MCRAREPMGNPYVFLSILMETLKLLFKKSSHLKNCMSKSK